MENKLSQVSGGFVKPLIWFAHPLIWWVAGSSEDTANSASA
jgi:hypothetical protein